MLNELLIACLVAIFGSIFSHSAIWYKIGKIENQLKKINGEK